MGRNASGIRFGSVPGSMRLLSAVLVALSLFLTGVRGNHTSRTCIFQTLNDSDKGFCKGDLEVIYPNVGDVSCSYIPKCHGYRRQISRDWGSPHVRYPWAEKEELGILLPLPLQKQLAGKTWSAALVSPATCSAALAPCQVVEQGRMPIPRDVEGKAENKKYVLVMVDPDAPNRANPRHRYWRHWVVTNILDHQHHSGITWVSSRHRSGYVRPSPPPHSGYHRYQVRLYAQPAHEHISLSPEEDASLGKDPLGP
ncbi:phosphatidylethanolamine-binding protein 4 [Pitangus sulphuratus]|nr:phosphatidylethanolamine-binding protein 4 [Pitangus sulphuratus]